MAHNDLYHPLIISCSPFLACPARPTPTTSSSELRSIAWHPSPSSYPTCRLQEHRLPASLHSTSAALLTSTHTRLGPPCPLQGLLPCPSFFLQYWGSPDAPRPARRLCLVPRHGKVCRCLPQHPYPVPHLGYDHLEIRRTWSSNDSLSRCLDAVHMCLGMAPCAVDHPTER